MYKWNHLTGIWASISMELGLDGEFHLADEKFCYVHKTRDLAETVTATGSASFAFKSALTNPRRREKNIYIYRKKGKRW